MKAKNGISLIVLVITIVVIIILAAAVILSLNNNNPINNSRVATISQTRDNLESAISMYLSNKFAKYSGDYDALQILSAQKVLNGTAEGNAITGETAVITLPTTTAGNTLTVDGTVYYKLNVNATKEKVEIDLTKEQGVTWYVAPYSGKVFAKFDTIPSYLKNSDGTVVDTVKNFVTQ